MMLWQGSRWHVYVMYRAPHSRIGLAANRQPQQQQNHLQPQPGCILTWLVVSFLLLGLWPASAMSLSSTYHSTPLSHSVTAHQSVTSQYVTSQSVTQQSAPTTIITAPPSATTQPPAAPAPPTPALPKLHIVTEHFPPFQIKHPKALEGWAVQRMQALLTEANLVSTIEVLPWPRAYKIATTRPNTLIFSLLKTEERQAQFHWIAPLCPMHIGFYTSEARADINATTLNALKPYVVGVERGQANQHYLQKHGFIIDKNLVLVQHKDVLHQMLALGRVDVVLLSQHYVQQWQQQHPTQPALKPLFIAEDLAQMLYIAAHIDSDPALIAQLTHAWQQLATQPQPPCPSDRP